MHAYRRTFRIGVLVLLVTGAAAAGWFLRNHQDSDASTVISSVLTYHNDNARTGQNLGETLLTPANVKHPGFKKLFSDAVDKDIFAQPLYVPGVSIPGQGTHNVVYVVTENDSVYAFDADTAGKTLWKVSFINPAAGITTVPDSDVNDFGDSSVFGITATPVIDGSSGTLYVLAFTKESGVHRYRLHALNIATGAEKFGGPVALGAQVAGTGQGSTNGEVPFEAVQQNTRPALLLSNGKVYISSGAFVEATWHGWMLAYNATTLAHVATFNTTPDAQSGALWMSGGGPAADSQGNVFVATANGPFNANTGGSNYGDSYLKLNGGTLAVTDYFTPSDEVTLDNEDLDLGSGAAMLLPPQAGTSIPNLLVGGGKDGTVYLVNRDNMGKFNSSSNKAVQTIPQAIGESGCASADNGCTFDTPTYWENKVYFAGAGDTLKAFQLNNGLLVTAPISHSAATFPTRGATPAISANGATNGIVWVVDSSAFYSKSGGPAILRAYNANNLSTELYDSNQAGTADQPGPAVKFAVPTVANGKVYIATRTQLTVYGLN
jgi:hypothetical protein